MPTIDDDTKAKASGSQASGLAPLAFGVALLALAPGVALTLLAGMIATEYRKVRTSRWLIASAATFAVALVITTFAGTSILLWLTTGAARTWAGFILPADPASATGMIGFAAANTGASWAFVIGTQIVAGVPIGLLLTAGYSAYRSYSRRLQNQIEGPEYSSARPFGILDKVNRDRQTRLISEGHYMVLPHDSAVDKEV